MNGSVSRLCDIDSIAIPADMLEISVNEQDVEDGVKALAMRYAAESEAGTAERGDVVHCRADETAYPDGRTVLIFTGIEMPCAEEAAKAAIGKKPGDVFETQLAGKTVKLTVEKIIRRTPVEVNDALIASIGIDGVATVEEYKNHLREKALADVSLEKHKMASIYLLDKLIDGSEYSYDEAEFEEFFRQNLSAYSAEDEMMGMQADPDELRQSALRQQKQCWAAEAFCKSRGIEIDKAAAEADADQMKEMMELMGEEVPPHEELVEMALQSAYFDALFGYMDGIIEKRIGGSNGNG